MRSRLLAGLVAAILLTLVGSLVLARRPAPLSVVSNSLDLRPTSAASLMRPPSVPQAIAGNGSAKSATAAGVAGMPTSAQAGPVIPLTNPSGQQLERSVAASYTVPPGKFFEAFNTVISQASAIGGYVDSSTTFPDPSGAILQGNVTVKIPSDKLSAFLAGLPKYFHTSSMNFSTIDHTSEFVDVNAELSAAQAHHDVLLRLLNAATNLSDIVQIEDQIAQVEQQINTLEGQLQALQHSVDYATATISMSEQGANVIAPAAPSPWQPLWDAVGTGLGNARDLIADFIAGLLTALPVLVLLAILYFTRRSWLTLFRRHTVRVGQPAQG